ncbi:MAG: hypothetical protein R3C13_10845 [Hyphomonas sp.]|uniref:hypothetical protein n=1 Tax=Hyphomonas sp. TaxID=87 RepID=UPI0035289651
MPQARPANPLLTVRSEGAFVAFAATAIRIIPLLMAKAASLLKQVRFYAVMLLVAALSVRGAVPSGYMLDEAQDGRGIVIRMCGAGGGAHDVYLDLTRGKIGEVPDKSGSQDDGDDDSTAPCPFAMNAAVDVTEPPAFHAPALFGPPQIGARIYVRQIASDPVTAPLPARGPPVLV